MEIKKSNFNWWAFLLNGIIAIIYGVLTFTAPADVMVTIITISGIVVIVTGLICLLIAFRRKKNMLPYGLLLFESILLIALGAVAIIWSSGTIKVLGIIIGLWALSIGAFQLFTILNLKGLYNKGFYILSAILSIGFGVLLVFKPFESAQVVTVLSGILALTFGLIMIMFAMNVRRLEKAVDKAMNQTTVDGNAEVMDSKTES